MADAAGPVRIGRRTRPARALGALVVAFLLGACGAHSSALEVPSAPTTSPSSDAVSSPAAPAADLAAIEAALKAINATAGGSVAAQRAVLQRLVVPSEADAQHSCPPAHNTLRLGAVPDDLRRDPDESSAASTTASTDTGGGAADYLLPVLITIFTGDRITGTDLTTLRLSVTDGTARIGHLCVS